MKMTHKWLSALICVAMLLTLCVGVSAAGSATNLSADITATTAEVGDEITLTISNGDMNVRSIKAGFYFDNTKLEVDKITWENIVAYSEEEEDDVDNGPASKTSKKKANTDGAAFGVYAINSGADSDCYEGVIVTVKFIAIAEGDAVITLIEESVGNDAFKSDSVETLTITIGSSCDHTNQNFRLDSNANGTHNVVCDDCGQAVQENVTCTVDESKTRYEEATIANCCEPGNQWKYTYCVCGYAFETELLEGSIPATGKHIIEKFDEVPATCINPGHKTYWRCDTMGFMYTDEDATQRVDESWLILGGEGYLAPDPDNHEPGYETTHYTNNGDDHTVTVKCLACGKPVSTTTEGHTYNPNTHVCECTAVEEFDLFLVDADGNRHEFSVPYGENLAKYLNDANLVVPEQKNIDADLRKGVETFKGWCTMDGQTWFTEDSVMPAQDMIVVTYYEFTGWDKNGSANNPWVYEIKDVAQKTGWTEIGDFWYYLDTVSGARAEGLTRVPYPTTEINGIKYAPNAEDVAYAAANADSKYTDAETAVFCFDENGMFQQTTGIVDGNRYAVDGMIGWHVGLVEVNGDYYYFKGDELGGGNIMATGKVYATRDYNTRKSVGSSCIYYFGDDGKLCEYDGITELEGVLYYFENSRLMIGAGLTKVGNEYIYVRSNGMLAIGQYWVSNTNKICDPGMYTFGDDGFMEGVQDPTVNGIEDGYYYKNGKPYYAGLIEIDGVIYYVKSNGQLATGTYYITKTNDMPGFEKGDKLVFDADGKLVTE